MCADHLNSRITKLEDALVEYVELYGLTEKARQILGEPRKPPKDSDK